jgi:hypothetical protein
VGAGGEMTQALYAHMNNKRKMKKKKRVLFPSLRTESYSFVPFTSVQVKKRSLVTQ